MASPKIQDLAARLVAFQAAQNTLPCADADAVVQVVDGLRLQLVRLAGADGFRSLLARALTLAKAEAPELHNVQISADGTLKGLDDVEPVREVAKPQSAGPQSAEPKSSAEAGTILVASLLELLVTFIGEILTLHLVRDAWPDAFFNGEDLSTEEKS